MYRDFIESLGIYVNTWIFEFYPIKFKNILLKITKQIASCFHIWQILYTDP